MRISIENKKIEAVKRMRALGIFQETIRQFEDEGLVSVSEPPLGAFFWADDEMLECIRQFEKKNDALVYVVIRSYTTIGRMDSFLFVSDHAEEWECDHEDIDMAFSADSQGVLAFVSNIDAPDCSEMGYSGISQTPAAGLRRIW